MKSQRIKRSRVIGSELELRAGARKRSRVETREEKEIFRRMRLTTLTRVFIRARRQRQGQRRLKNEFIFYHESRNTLKSFTLPISCQTITKLRLGLH